MESAQQHFYLLRGLTRESGHWCEFPIALQKVFPNAKITLLNIPGTGEYFEQTSPWQVSGFVTALRADFLAARESNEEAILIAISLGGMISAEWMRRYPNDFQKTVLINTSFGCLSPWYQRMQPAALFRLITLPSVQASQRERTILKLVSHNPETFEQSANHWDMIRNERPVSLSNSLRQLKAAAGFKLNGWKPSIPVLLIASTNDRLVNVTCSRKIAKTWQVPLVEHSSGGHDLPLDDPGWLADQVRVFAPGKD